MKAMFFLIRKEIKNGLLEMLRHPARLILYLAVVALLVFSLLSGSGRKSGGGFLDFRILHGIYLIALLFIAVPSILTGLKSGTTFFKMSDVNFLFVSPISPKEILAYGLIKQMASTLLMMTFLLFYGGMAATAFGVTIGQTVTLVLGVALMVFTIQIIVLLVYMFSSGHPERVRLIETCLYSVLGIMVAFILAGFLLNGSTLEALYAAIASPYLEFVPIVGWIKGMIFAIINANTANLVIYAILNGITVVGSILLFANSDSDYYEDVLQSTETTFERKKSIKSGRMSAMSAKPRKVTDTGINHGWGANTFFFKHLRQNKRQNSVPFLGMSTVVILIVNIILVVFLRGVSGSGEDAIPAGMLMPISLALSCYIMFFMNAAGDWTLELQKPYIYLVPAKPFDKLLWATLSTMIKPVIDGIIVFTVLCLFLRANPATAILCMLIYASMGFLFTAANVLSQRLFGQLVNKGLTMLFYMIVLLLLLAPGVIVSAVLYFAVSWLPGFVIGLPVVIWNILVSLCVFAACRNLLSTVEFNN
jgi:hypothetical protein